MTVQRLWLSTLFATFLAGPASGGEEKAKPELAAEEQRGRYLVEIAGCNDCHTAGYAVSGGAVPESEWLKGDRLGWQGPWGTTYASNLRLRAAELSAEQFMALARSELRPPMPWFNLRSMTDEDVRAIYAYLRHLGPAGDPAPAWVPPDRTAGGPVVIFPAPPAPE